MHLMQAATMPQTSIVLPVVLAVVTTIFSVLMTLSFFMLSESSKDRREMRARQDEHAQIISRIVAQLGVDDGSGLSAKLDDVVEEVKGLRKDMHAAVMAIAQHGAN